jgi:hypothetical protein
MAVTYDDGTAAELRVNIQERIWENIQADLEVQAARQERRQRAGGVIGNFYLKTVESVTDDDLALPGLRDKLVIVENEHLALRSGDRMIYYAVDQQLVFAVATITGDAKSINQTLFNLPGADDVNVFPIDVDASVKVLEHAVGIESVGLESQPDVKNKLKLVDLYLAITEDEFELLAELVTEVSEDEDELEDELDDDDDDLDDSELDV